MCRNIKTLYNFEPPASKEEIREAALQYVRKITGFTHPSKANRVPFLNSVDAIAAISRDLLNSLEATVPPKNRADQASQQKNPVRTYSGSKP